MGVDWQITETKFKTWKIAESVWRSGIRNYWEFLHTKIDKWKNETCSRTKRRTFEDLSWSFIGLESRHWRRGNEKIWFKGKTCSWKIIRRCHRKTTPLTLATRRLTIPMLMIQALKLMILAVNFCGQIQIDHTWNFLFLNFWWFFSELEISAKYYFETYRIKRNKTFERLIDNLLNWNTIECGSVKSKGGQKERWIL